MTTVAVARTIPAGLLVGLGAVVFLANSGLLVLQLLAGRYLAPFIGSSVETWTCVIGVFLTGIAMGNHYGGRLADRAPSTKTLGKLLLAGAVSSLSLILGWTLCQNTGIDRAIPLGLRIPILAAIFCLPPGFVLSLITPLTIKLMMSDVTRAGRIAGLVFALSTLGCLLGNYATGFWLMADYTLNAISIGVAVGLTVLAVPMFLLDYRLEPAAPGAAPRPVSRNDAFPGFRKDIRRAYLVVFVASFCGMSLELTASRVLAPILGVSLYTWTGIIGVMLAGTACGNYLGGVLADRGTKVALQRFALVMGTAAGFAAAPAAIRSLGLNGWPAEGMTGAWVVRFAGALAGAGLVLWALSAAHTRRGQVVNMFAIGAAIGFAAAHPVARSFSRFVGRGDLHEALSGVNESVGFDLGSLLVHLIGAAVGGAISLGLGYDSPKEEKPKAPTSALAVCLFCGALFSGLVVLLSLFFQNPQVGVGSLLSGKDIVWNVLTWTFLLFFLPMFCLGTISPQVIRLSIPDTAHAGRTAGTIYAWSTAGAIVGTFVTGYFLIDLLGMARVLFVLSMVLMGMAFVLGRLWMNTPLLFAGSIVFFAGAAGLTFIGAWSGGYTLETKYYAIKVGNDKHGQFGEETKTLTLDALVHSYVRPDDPTWLGYKHEEIQGELARYYEAKGPTEILVIGGGGYTFPRWMEYMLPRAGVDVVEIDPGVTEVAHRELGLARNTKIRSIHMDGRQFIREKASKKHYHLVMQDAVNDLSVPYHLMTKEYNDAVKATLADGGAYLLTLIDSMENGDLWRAAVETMRKSFKYVEMLDPADFQDTKSRHVYVIYGSDQPLDLAEVRAVAGEAALRNGTEAKPYSHAIDKDRLDAFLAERPGIVLTDQYAPVDNLMSSVFRTRTRGD